MSSDYAGPVGEVLDRLENLEIIIFDTYAESISSDEVDNCFAPMTEFMERDGEAVLTDLNSSKNSSCSSSDSFSVITSTSTAPF